MLRRITYRFGDSPPGRDFYADLVALLGEAPQATAHEGGLRLAATRTTGRDPIC